MKVLVCGSRSFNDFSRLTRELSELGDISEIIHGTARGADTCAEAYARIHNIKVTGYRASWYLHGKSAGAIRNGEMLREGNPDMVIAFWDGESKGTQNMIEQATKAGVPVKVVDIG